MSMTSTPVDEHLFAFLAARTIPEDDFLRELVAAAATAGLPPIHIAPEQGAFLRLLLQAVGARTVVEVGTLGGYSAITMARGMPAGGRVITHEIEPRHAEFARQWVARSDQADKVEVRLGDAGERLTELPAAQADAVFLDADKTGYVDYLRQAMRLLRTGGLLLADNVLAGGRVADGTDETAVAVRAFLDEVARTEDLQSVIVPLGDGLLFGVKQGMPKLAP